MFLARLATMFTALLLSQSPWAIAPLYDLRSGAKIVTCELALMLDPEYVAESGQYWEKNAKIFHQKAFLKPYRLQIVPSNGRWHLIYNGKDVQNIPAQEHKFFYLNENGPTSREDAQSSRFFLIQINGNELTLHVRQQESAISDDEKTLLHFPYFEDEDDESVSRNVHVSLDGSLDYFMERDIFGLGFELKSDSLPYKEYLEREKWVDQGVELAPEFWDNTQDRPLPEIVKYHSSPTPLFLGTYNDLP